jgi:hypothetical protein
MLPHPKTMQTMTDQRWHELTVKTQHERLAMTIQRQTRQATYLTPLRLMFVNAVRMLPPILARHQEIRAAGDAQQLVIP